MRQNFKQWERKLAPPIQGHYYWPEKVKSPLEIREALLPQMTSSDYLEVLIMNEGKVKQETELSLPPPSQQDVLTPQELGLLDKYTGNV